MAGHGEAGERGEHIENDDHEAFTERGIVRLKRPKQLTLHLLHLLVESPGAGRRSHALSLRSSRNAKCGGSNTPALRHKIQKRPSPK
jgi:hypothetical protein